MLIVRRMKDPERGIVKSPGQKYRRCNPIKLETKIQKLTMHPLLLKGLPIKSKEKTRHFSIEKLLGRENRTVQHKAHVHAIKDHPPQSTKS